MNRLHPSVPQQRFVPAAPRVDLNSLDAPARLSTELVSLRQRPLSDGLGWIVGTAAMQPKIPQTWGEALSHALALASLYGSVVNGQDLYTYVAQYMARNHLDKVAPYLFATVMSKRVDPSAPLSTW